MSQNYFINAGHQKKCFRLQTVPWLKWLQLKIGIVAQAHHTVAPGTWSRGREHSQGCRLRATAGAARRDEDTLLHWKRLKHSNTLLTALSVTKTLTSSSFHCSSALWPKIRKAAALGMLFPGTRSCNALEHSSNVQTLQITTKIRCREHRQILRAAWECPWCNFLHSPPTAWDSLRTVLGRRIDSVVSGLLRVCPTILMSLFLTKHNSVTSDPIYFNAVQVSNILCY